MIEKYWIPESFLGGKKPKQVDGLPLDCDRSKKYFCCIDHGGISCAYDMGM